MLVFKFTCPPVETNTYVFATAENEPAAVVDPSQGCTDKILSLAEEKGLKIEKILLTHSHWDHILDACTLQEKTGAKLFVHPLDAGNVESPGVDGLTLFTDVQPAVVNGFLKDGDEIAVGSLKLKVIHTPGHSPGGVCLYLEKEKVLFSGDTLFHGSCGRIDLPTSAPKDMWPSLKKLAKLPKETKVYSGHGPDSRIVDEPWIEKAEEFFG